MTSPSIFWVIAAGLFVGVSLAPSSRRKFGLRRLGTDPGLFNLWIWPARIQFLRKGSKLVYESYQSDKDTNYVVQTLMGDLLVLSPKYLPELRKLPERCLNATAALVDSVLGKYSGVDLLLRDHLSSDMCRGPLTKNLSNIVPQMSHELQLAYPEVFQACENGDQVAYVAYKSIYSLISRISSRVFVGAPICHNQEWIEPVRSYPMDVEKTKLALLLFPSFMRPWLVYLLPMKWRLKRNHTRVRNILFPSSHVKKSKEEYTVLNFLIQSSKDDDTELLTSRIILLTAAAFHNSATAALQAVYNLCVMPEYVRLLRTEAEEALRQTGGNWTLETVQSLHRLDSFLKESQRLNGLSFLGFNRKVMSEIKLSNGTSIPAGQTIRMPSGPMARDETYYENPLTFDGGRFYGKEIELRRGEKPPENDYAGIEPGNLTWGHGRFSCPGRWFASVMIKLLLATFLLEYDFELTGNPDERPQNMVFDVRVLPDMKQKISLKTRQK